MELELPRLGDKVRFAPEAFTGDRDPAQPKRAIVPKVVTGTIVYVNRAHRYYTAEFSARGVTMRESFKF
jgi:hypothetical protein